MIEMVVYLGVITGKFLEHCTTFKLLLSSPQIMYHFSREFLEQVVCTIQKVLQLM